MAETARPLKLAAPAAPAALLGLALALLAVWPVVDGLALLPWATAGATAASLGALGTPVAWQGDLLRHAGGFVAQVHRDCTVLWPAWLLLAGLAVLLRASGAAPRRIFGAMLLGVLFVAAVNQLRLAGVIWLGVHAPAHYGLVHEVLAPCIQVAAMAAYLAAAFVFTSARGPADACSSAPDLSSSLAPALGASRAGAPALHAGAGSGLAGRRAGGAAVACHRGAGAGGDGQR